MLITLAIQDFVIIESLDLNFPAGFSVLTGETGAGKSILLDALGLALGRRGESGLIRKGAEQATIALEFQPSPAHPVWHLLEEQGIPHEGSIMVRRVLSHNGRHRTFVNDQLVSLNLIRQLGDYMLEIHGQHDRLLDSTKHRELLDAFHHHQELIDETALEFSHWQKLKQNFDQEQQRLDHLKRDEDLLKFQLQELAKLHLTAGEEEQLLEERHQLAYLGRLWDVVQQSTQHLCGNPVLEAIHLALKVLQRSQNLDNEPLAKVTQALEKAASELTEAVSQLEEIQAKLAGQPERLQQIDDRLHTLRGAARKHQVMPDQLPAYFLRLQHDLSHLNEAEQRLQELSWEVEQAKQAYYQKAKQLHQVRCKGGEQLDTRIQAELPDLHLPNAQFKTMVTELPEDQWHEKGLDRVRFFVAMNKGQDLYPLEKAASGGEQARLMLALKAILASTSHAPTIVFDEIDIGVGGAVAAAIGARLHQLAEQVQVLSITHSPQVAASAQYHFHVTKQDLGASMRTQVMLLAKEQRSEEIARMLSGSEVTSEARAAAQILLKRYA
jgi:DNA repair protein RecN (Recombination protein N)